MAISASTVWEVRTGGSEINGGGYSSGGTDYSQQTAAQLSVTDGAGSSTTNLNSVTGGFTSAMVGNVLCISGGTLTTGRYQIVAFVDTNNVTLDRALNTGSGSTVKVGGAVSAPEHLDTAATYPGVVPGNIVYISSDVTGTADGTKTTTRTLTCDGTITGGEIAFIGYPAGGSRTDVDIIEGSMPVFTTATNSIAKFSINGCNRVRFRNIKVTDTAATRGNGFAGVTASSSGITIENCVTDGCLVGFTTGGFNWNQSTFSRCVARNGTSHGFNIQSAGAGVSLQYCTANANAGTGFIVSGNASDANFYFCLAYANTGASGNGFSNSDTTTDSAATSRYFMCTAHGNAQNGFRWAWTTGGSRNMQLDNCIAYGNTVAEVSCATAGLLDGTTGLSAYPRVRNLAVKSGGGSSGERVNFRSGDGYIQLTADPFTNAAGGDFSLNSTAGGGALLRQLGYPTEIGVKGSTTTNYPCIGASQTQITPDAFVIVI